MTPEQFITAALPYLVEMFPEMAKRIETQGQSTRWLTRFVHLDLSVWTKAVDAYADDNHFPPTVNKLMEYVPESQRTKTGKSDYTRPGAYKAFEPIEPPAHDADFVPNWAEVYRRLNERDWGMNASGDD